MLETNKIYLGDCLDLMEEIPDKSIDLVLTDPPYGIKRDKGFEGFGGFGKPIARKEYQGDWDSGKIEDIYFNEIFRISKEQIIFGGNFYTDNLPVNAHWIFWDKINTMPTFGDGELAWTSFKRNSVKQITLQYNGLLGKEINRFHATQKPVKLFEMILKDYSNESDLILDPFSGSGTTAIACHNLNRNFICIEKDPEYHRKSVERYNKHILQLKLNI